VSRDDGVFGSDAVKNFRLPVCKTRFYLVVWQPAIKTSARLFAASADWVLYCSV